VSNARFTLRKGSRLLCLTCMEERRSEQITIAYNPDLAPDISPCFLGKSFLLMSPDLAPHILLRPITSSRLYPAKFPLQSQSVVKILLLSLKHISTMSMAEVLDIHEAKVSPFGACQSPSL
jgi:hypothetical protein